MRAIVGVLCAVVMFAMAMPVQAFTLYEKGNFSYRLDGDWQIQFRQAAGDDQDFAMDYDDLELKNYAKYQVTDDIWVGGRVDLAGDKAADASGTTEMQFEEARLEVGYKNYKVYFGTYLNAMDMWQIGPGVRYETDDAIGRYSGVDLWGACKGDDLVSFEAKKIGGILTIRADIEMEDETDSTDKYGPYWDVSVGAAKDAWSVAGIYQVIDHDTRGDVSTWGVNASYDFKVVKLLAEYSATEAEDDDNFGGGFATGAVVVPYKDWTFKASYLNVTYEDDAEDDVNGWSTSIVYHIPQTKAWVIGEVQNSDVDDSDPGYMLGLRFRF